MKKVIYGLVVALVVAVVCYASTILVDKNLSILITSDQVIVLVQRGVDGKIILEAPVKNPKYNEVQIRTKKLQDRVEKE